MLMIIRQKNSVQKIAFSLKGKRASGKIEQWVKILSIPSCSPAGESRKGVSPLSLFTSAECLWMCGHFLFNYYYYPLWFFCWVYYFVGAISIRAMRIVWASPSPSYNLRFKRQAHDNERSENPKAGKLQTPRHHVRFKSIDTSPQKQKPKMSAHIDQFLFPFKSLLHPRCAPSDFHPNALTRILDKRRTSCGFCGCVPEDSIMFCSFYALSKSMGLGGILD